MFTWIDGLVFSQLQQRESEVDNKDDEDEDDNNEDNNDDDPPILSYETANAELDFFFLAWSLSLL